ncbi:MAG: heavy-metal-associated domain-containing protein [Terriglobia bacterium]|jgi:mercuric ion binding protein|nr:heavy-metal-associated domain-containing protein [Terriglobia bacterium]
MKSLTTLFLLLLFAGSAFAKDVKTEIKVSGMTCGACAVSVKSALTKVKGVKRADVSHEKGLATVVYDDEQTNEQQLREAINKTGFKESSQEKK